MRHLPTLLLVTATFAASAALAAPAGTVAFLQGDVNIRGAQGAVRSAATGVAVESGETIETGRGRAQLRMVDGAYISLQPDTTLRLDAYQRAGAGAAESGFMSLLRGGMRTITGLIGRTDRAAYRITTPTATVGIRGTEFLATADEGTRVRVAGGRVALCNDGGCLDIASGQTGYAPSSSARPTLVSQAPSLPPTPAPAGQTEVYVAADQRTGDGASLSFEGSPGTGVPTGYRTPIANGAGSFVPLFSRSGGPTVDGGLLGSTNTSDSQGQLVSYVDCCSGVSATMGTMGDWGADGVIAWGRWSTGTWTGSPINFLHYIATSNATVPTGTVTQAFVSFASTAPTLSSHSTGALLATGTPNSVTGTLSLSNFVSGGSGTGTYSLVVPIAGDTFTASGSFNQFSGGWGFLGNGSTTTIGSYGGHCPCTGEVPFGDAIQGVVAGSGSDLRVGATYAFRTTLGGGTNIVSGAVVFK